MIINFFGDQIIVNVYTEPENLNPYEITLFEQMTIYSKFILATSSVKRPKIALHLPDVDYLLFGTHLYVTGKMTKRALGMFIHKVIRKKKEYTGRLQKIFKLANLETSSPFCGIVDLSTQTIVTLHDKIEEMEARDDLEILQLYEELADTFINLSGLQLKTPQGHLCQNTFIQSLSDKLEKPSFESDFTETWRDFTRAAQAVKICDLSTLEGILRVGNAVFAGHHTKGRKKGETCSVLPLLEKPIQITYAKLCKELSSKSANYSPMFNMTTLEAVIPYGLSRNTSIFNFGVNPNSLAKLLVSHLHVLKKNTGFQREEERKEAIASLVATK